MTVEGTCGAAEEMAVGIAMVGEVGKVGARLESDGEVDGEGDGDSWGERIGN